jgi:hypothetical protein
MLREIIVRQCADRWLHETVAGSTNTAGREICQQQSLYRQLLSISPNTVEEHREMHFAFVQHWKL